MINYPLTMKRVYEKSEKEDGYRILVDRIWPRGVSKQKADIDDWTKEITPTTMIRKEFDHQPQKFDWFKKAYWAELESNPYAQEFIEHVFDELQQAPVTFVYAAKDEQFNHVVILIEFVQTKMQ
ncbi:DUF488 domain-containing protein [Carnobacterium alterfunditum]|uniref:DUF488 domain-containing protein n=1 Tax=Carnobacterium alterfunditum TaxID=28230 RepID=UPI003593D2D8